MTLVGCAGQVSKRDAAGFDTDIAQGNYAAAATFAQSAGKIGPDGKSDNLVWMLQDGSALIHAGDATHVVPVLDNAEDMMKSTDLQTVGNGQYQHATYDGVMANTYKALAFLAQGDRDKARTEFLRAEDRQRRAEDDRAKQKQALDSQLQADRAKNPDIDVDKGFASVTTSKEYQDAQNDMAAYGGYAPFINPFSAYLAGIFRIADPVTPSDIDSGVALLRRVRGVAGPGAAALLDSDIALATRRGPRKPQTWVIFESGMAPSFAEYRVTFPVPIIGKNPSVSTVTVALPRMVFHQIPADGLRITAGAGPGIPTAPIASFDRVMKSEFDLRQQDIIMRAVVEAALKVAIQEAAGQTNNAYLKLATKLVANISSADTRSWTALPAEFYAARVISPADGKLHIATQTGVDLGDITVPTDRSSVVLVTLPMAGALPAMQVYPL